MSDTPRAALAFSLYLCATTATATYFGYSAIRGDQGVLARLVINSELSALEVEEKILTQELEELRNLSNRLSDKNLDLDLLDEQARRTLGMLRPDELVIEETSIKGQ